MPTITKIIEAEAEAIDQKLVRRALIIAISRKNFRAIEVSQWNRREGEKRREENRIPFNRVIFFRSNSIENIDELIDNSYDPYYLLRWR